MTRDDADKVLIAIGQATLTDAEYIKFECLTKGGQYDVYDALVVIVNNRGGNGDAVAKIKAYAELKGESVGLSKKVPNNVFLGAVL